MATSGQFCWPSVGSSVAAYGQFRMAANRARHSCTGARITPISVRFGKTMIGLEGEIATIY